MGIFGRDETPPEQTPSPPGAVSDGKKTAPVTTDRTVIARPTIVEGRVSGSGEIIVNGQVKGTIEANGSVVVAEEGRVTAVTHGRTVTVAGTVNGDISADETIELEATARVEGDMTAPRIMIRDGATFRGQVNMKDSGRKTAVRTSSAHKDSDVESGS
jgi:cytoskeletal protein CcmA (bactofilin family)